MGAVCLPPYDGECNITYELRKFDLRGDPSICHNPISKFSAIFEASTAWFLCWSPKISNCSLIVSLLSWSCAGRPERFCGRSFHDQTEYTFFPEATRLRCCKIRSVYSLTLFLTYYNHHARNTSYSITYAHFLNTPRLFIAPDIAASLSLQHKWISLRMPQWTTLANTTHT